MLSWIHISLLELCLNPATHTKTSLPWLVQSNAVVLPKGTSLELVSCGATPFPLAAVLACVIVSGVGLVTQSASPQDMLVKGISRAHQTSHCQQEWCMQLWHLPDVLLLRTRPMCSRCVCSKGRVNPKCIHFRGPLIKKTEQKVSASPALLTARQANSLPDTLQIA